MAVGLVFIAAGLGLILLFAVGLMPSAEASLEAPRWVVACVGLTFALGGGAVIVGYAVAGGAGPDGDLPPGTPRWVRLTQSLLGLGIIGSLGVIFSWIAFGPGPRAFTITLPFVGRVLGEETAGRAVFGIGAVLIWVFFVVIVVVSARRLRRK